MSLANDAHSFPDLDQKFISDSHRWLLQQHALLRRLIDGWAAKRRHARAMAELYRFSDRELQDIALSRADVMAIDKGQFRRE